jgi:hypothetical protein
LSCCADAGRAAAIRMATDIAAVPTAATDFLLPSSHADTSSRMVYTTGTTISVSSVEVMRPPTTARAIGARNSAPSPSAKNSGSMPKIIAVVVIRIGRSRVRPAVTSAARRSRPRRRSTFV